MENETNKKSNFHVKFSHTDGNMIAAIELPSPTGLVTVKTGVPLADVRGEVTAWLDAHDDDIGDDIAVLEAIPIITQRAAKRRLIRKLHDNVGYYPGGPKTESMDALARTLLADARGGGVLARTAQRKIRIIKKEAARRDPAAVISLAALNRVSKQELENKETSNMLHDEISGLQSFAKKVGKGIAKVAVKTDTIVTENPLSRVLISTVPGGAAALSATDYSKNAVKVIKAAKGGNKKAVDSLKELKAKADAGDPGAQAALKALSDTNNDLKKPKKDSAYLRAVRLGMYIAPEGSTKGPASEGRGLATHF